MLSDKASTLQHALAYNHAGLSTIPIRSDGSKAPAINSWKPYRDVRPDEGLLRAWFADSDHGIAIIHGAVSGGSEVIDIDDGDLLDPFFETLDQLMPGLRHKLCVVETPRPGYHLIYRCDKVEGNQKLAGRPPNDAETARANAEGRKATPVTTIETRGEGGYTVAPGSPGSCHSTGRQYTHHKGVTLDKLTRISTTERNALLMTARSLDQLPVEDPPAQITKTDTQVYDGESPGDAYDRMTDWPAILEPQGWVCVRSNEDRSFWRRPGKADGVSATTGNVSQKGRDLLCVFSTNAQPFDGQVGSRPCSTHSKFDAYARLQHDGDHIAAARELSRKGYGDHPKAPRRAVTFRRITCAELAAGDYQIEFLIERMLVKDQPMVIAGPQKTMKTSILIDASVSLATGTPMLGELVVPQAKRVLVMSGESGLATIQETTRRIANSKGLRLEDVENLIFSPDVPKFGNLSHADAIREMLADNGIEVLVIDPAYLAMPGAEAGNLMIQGAMLQDMGKVCESLGVTMVVAHHTKRSTNSPKNEPLQLSDIAWAGFPEYFRQWWLLNRRERYDEGSGKHALWMSVGGSAGHSVLLAVDVSEGICSPNQPRCWDADVTCGHTVRQDQQLKVRDSKANERLHAANKKLECEQSKVLTALGKLGPETCNTIASAARLSNGKASAALTTLTNKGVVRKVSIKRSNGQEYDGYELTEKRRVQGQQVAK